MKFRFLKSVLTALLILALVSGGLTIWDRHRAKSILGLSMTMSEHEMKERLMEIMPIGTSAANLLGIINGELANAGRPNVQYRTSSGAFRLKDHWEDKSIPMSDLMIGSRSIKVLLGRYTFWQSFYIFETLVFVSWGFDEKDKLIGIYIHKEMDTP